MRVREELEAARAELAALRAGADDNDTVLAAEVEALQTRIAVLERATTRYPVPPGGSSR